MEVENLPRLMRGAGFLWGLSGGYAVEKYLGKNIRKHSDIDISILRIDHLKMQKHLTEWEFDVPCIRIEIQLLYKATGEIREKDKADFQECLKVMESDRTRWLLEKLILLNPGHAWIRPLEMALEDRR